MTELTAGILVGALAAWTGVFVGVLVADSIRGTWAVPKGSRRRKDKAGSAPRFRDVEAAVGELVAFRAAARRATWSDVVEGKPGAEGVVGFPTVDAAVEFVERLERFVGLASEDAAGADEGRG